MSDPRRSASLPLWSLCLFATPPGPPRLHVWASVGLPAEEPFPGVSLSAPGEEAHGGLGDENL